MDINEIVLGEIKIGENETNAGGINLPLIKGEQGLQGIQGIPGEKGDTGETGPSNTLTIGTVTKGEEASATITGESPNQVLNLVLPKGDTGDAFTYEDFTPEQLAALKGDDGISPTLEETQTANGYDISITDVNGTRIIGLTNGEDGANGRDGADGVSPTLTETATANGYDIAITDINGTRTISLVNGAKGDTGETGPQGVAGTNGTNGQDGYTPQRGTDYWTAADISAIEAYCANYIDAHITQAIGGEY